MSGRDYDEGYSQGIADYIAGVVPGQPYVPYKDHEAVTTVQQILTDVENGEYASAGRDFGRGAALVAKVIREELNAALA